MQINKIDLTKMRNDEHFQFITEFKNAVNKYGGAEKLKIQSQYTQFLTLYVQEDEAFKKIVKSAITEEIQAADKYRDRIFRGMADMVKVALNHFDEGVLAAGKRLKILFDTYGNLAQKPLNEETSAVYNILQDLNNVYKNDAAKINILDWMGELQAANEKFSQLVENRYEESAMKTDLVLKEVRTQVDTVYKSMTERINAYVVVQEKDDETPFVEFIKFFNAIIEKYANLIAQRYGKLAAKNNV